MKNSERDTGQKIPHATVRTKKKGIRYNILRTIIIYSTIEKSIHEKLREKEREREREHNITLENIEYHHNT